MGTSSTVRQVRNARGEVAYTDGVNWWMNAPGGGRLWLWSAVSLLRYGGGEGDLTDETIAKARRVFVSCLRGVAPKVTPSDAGENEILRVAWNDALSFRREHDVAEAGEVMFSQAALAVGVADALVRGEDGGLWAYCYTPKAAWEFLGDPLNALARWMHDGSCPEVDPHGVYSKRGAAYMVKVLMTWGDRRNCK